MPESKTSPRRVEAKQKQAKAVELRAAGVTFARIAEELGYTDESGARDAVKKALQATIQQPADELRQMELAKFDYIETRLAKQVAQGHLGAIDRLLKVIEARRKLLGLDAPERRELTADVTNYMVDIGSDSDDSNHT